MTARLLGFSSISPSGAFACVPGGPEFSKGDCEYPELRARDYFDESYPKFGRMDPLSKLAVAVVSLTYKITNRFHSLGRTEMAQVGGTMLGCLEVDAQFEQTRRAGQPSPARFVYTLPSMFQGEIAIAYGLQGRCTLLGAGELSGLTALATGIRWIERGRASAVLVVAADVCGPAALDWLKRKGVERPEFPSYAACWLLAAHDGESNGCDLSDVRFQPEDSAVELSRAKAGLGVSFVDSLEDHLRNRDGNSLRVGASAGGQSVSFAISY